MHAARGREAWGLARRQHGVVARGQLLALGFGSKAIRHRIETGRLHPVMTGVYSVGRRELSREGRWMAAVLACGDGAVLSHRSAAELWGIGNEATRIEVSIRRRVALRRPGVRVRARPSLSDRSVTAHCRIPATSPVQTLIDIATELPERHLERAVNEADKRDLVDPESLLRALEDHSGEPGVRPLRVLLHRHNFVLSDSELERLFVPLALEAGLPLPLTGQRVNGFEVDFFWPQLGLVVETDGWHYHRTPSTQSRDALRDQTHTAAGLTALRFSFHQVKYEPGHVRRILARTTAQLRSET